MARQEGKYLAALFSRNKLALVEPGSNGANEASSAELVPLPKRAKPFRCAAAGQGNYLARLCSIWGLVVQRTGSACHTDRWQCSPGHQVLRKDGSLAHQRVCGPNLLAACCLPLQLLPPRLVGLPGQPQGGDGPAGGWAGQGAWGSWVACSGRAGGTMCSCCSTTSCWILGALLRQRAKRQHSFTLWRAGCRLTSRLTANPASRSQFKTPFLKTLRGYLGAQTWRFLETYMQVGARALCRHRRCPMKGQHGLQVGGQRQPAQPARFEACSMLLFAQKPGFSPPTRVRPCCRRAAQVSDRTRWLVAQDWIRSFFFGRNISDI